MASGGTGAQECNGSAALCERRVDQVFFAATHNSMSSSNLQWMFPAQDTSIPEQLEAGYRALLLDTHTWEGSRAGIEAVRSALRPDQRVMVDALLAPFEAGLPGAFLCHGYCGFGATPLVEGLAEINSFLDRHPREVILLLLEDYISVEETRQAFEEAGLAPKLYEGAHDDWPTLRELIDSGQRVIVLAEHTSDGPSW